jgi:hypothetical protein
MELVLGFCKKKYCGVIYFSLENLADSRSAASKTATLKTTSL